MTQNQNDAHIPFSRHSPEVWAQVRREYLAGASAAVVAERYGLSERNVRRRAATEGWRRSDRNEASIAGDWPRVDRPSWAGGRPDIDEAIAIRPELAEVAAARAHLNMDLLFNPDPQTLGRFAFQKAAEAAAMSGPTEALAWVRLLQALDRANDRIVRDSQAFSDVDHLRAQYIRRMDDDASRACERPARSDEA